MCLRKRHEQFGTRAGERITAVRTTEDSLTIDLLDGRTVTVPLAWYPRLLARIRG
ncbi:MAG TPA: DUF2442 domain-containing protein [Thermoanaerobaculia bacterium]|nr:DUF2442 domain-containing protein [Thermoanaerobaculia bacterium]